MLQVSEASFIQTLSYQINDYSNWNLYHLHEKWLACVLNKRNYRMPGLPTATLKPS